jgi:hypothetical protein
MFHIGFVAVPRANPTVAEWIASHLLSQGCNSGLAKSPIHEQISGKITIRAKWELDWEKETTARFTSIPPKDFVRCCPMAEEKRDLIWRQTAFFMGWAPSACGWRNLIPRGVPTRTAPSDQSVQAFEEHKCLGTLIDKRGRLKSSVPLSD